MNKNIDNLKDLKVAISLIARFDTEEDDKTIDNLICHAINTGLDIEQYEDDDILLSDCI